MPNRLIRTVLFLCVCSPLPLQAQSFDCKKASTATETEICDSRALSSLDSKMAALSWVYDSVPMLMGASGDRLDAKREFLTTRDACGADKTCLTKVYQARIGTLKSEISVAMAEYCKAIEVC